jgi:hypothetical protein
MFSQIPCVCVDGIPLFYGASEEELRNIVQDLTSSLEAGLETVHGIRPGLPTELKQRQSESDARSVR